MAFFNYASPIKRISDPVGDLLSSLFPSVILGRSRWSSLRSTHSQFNCKSLNQLYIFRSLICRRSRLWNQLSMEVFKGFKKTKNLLICFSVSAEIVVNMKYLTLLSIPPTINFTQKRKATLLKEKRSVSKRRNTFAKGQENNY